MISKSHQRLNWELVPSPDAGVNAQGLVKVPDASRFESVEKILEECKVIAFPEDL